MSTHAAQRLEHAMHVGSERRTEAPSLGVLFWRKEMQRSEL